MILVTLGTQKFEMNRLIKAADQLAQTTEEVFVQCGHSTYQHFSINSKIKSSTLLSGAV